MPSTVPAGMWTPDRDGGAAAAPCFQPEIQFAAWNWQRQTAVQFGSRGPEQTAACASILLSFLVSTQRFHVHCSWFWVGAEEIPPPPVTHSTRDCGWNCSEISIASTVQAVSLQRPTWTTGLICLYYALPSYDLIWLRAEDWPKPQLGILFAPAVVFSSDWTLPEETSEDAFAVLKLYSTVIWGLLQHGNEIRTGKIVYCFWRLWKESTLWTSLLPQILLGDLFYLSLHRKESFPFPPAIHFSQISVKTNAVFCAEKDHLLHKRNIAIWRTTKLLLSPHTVYLTNHTHAHQTARTEPVSLYDCCVETARGWVKRKVLPAKSVSVAQAAVVSISVNTTCFTIRAEWNTVAFNHSQSHYWCYSWSYFQWLASVQLCKIMRSFTAHSCPLHM